MVLVPLISGVVWVRRGAAAAALVNVPFPHAPNDRLPQHTRAQDCTGAELGQSTCPRRNINRKRTETREARRRGRQENRSNCQASRGQRSACTGEAAVPRPPPASAARGSQARAEGRL